MPTSQPSLDLGEDKTVPEGTHLASSEVPSVQGSLLVRVRCLKQLSADGVAVPDGSCHSVVDSVEQARYRDEHVGGKLLNVIQKFQHIAPACRHTHMSPPSADVC